MIRRMAARSPSFVSRTPASTHDLAAASHCARLKMKKIAGSIDRACRSSTVSTRPGGPHLSATAAAAVARTAAYAAGAAPTIRRHRPVAVRRDSCGRR